jgi:hypothetical protein
MGRRACDLNLHSGSNLGMQDNMVVNDRTSGTMLWNMTGVAANISDTDVWGMTADQLVDGLCEANGTTFLAARRQRATIHFRRCCRRPPPAIQIDVGLHALSSSINAAQR